MAKAQVMLKLSLEELEIVELALQHYRGDLAKARLGNLPFPRLPEHRNPHTADHIVLQVLQAVNVKKEA